MDFKKLAGIVLGIGALGVIASLAWWYSFYSNVVGKSRGLSTMSDAFSCIYSSSGGCSVVSGISSLAGQTPYNPTWFWISIVVLAVGAVLQVSLKK